ncbi:MAG: T9SS type A sorting domain-containing protein [Saprospiraceae bacterium]|nr:T9SS type A sorting domain-containing protein [Saprospiraceae bacterium]
MSPLRCYLICGLFAVYPLLNKTLVFAQNNNKVPNAWVIQSRTLQLSETNFTALPSEYLIFHLDSTILKTELAKAPAEITTQRNQEGILLSLPTPDGKTSVFEIVKYEMMEPELAAQYPHIQTFKGHNVADPAEKIRLDWNELGFHAMVRSRKGVWMINPVKIGEKQEYIVFDRAKWPRNIDPFICDVEDISPSEPEPLNFGTRSLDCQFRSYRLAQATTGEYSNYFGASNSSQSGLVLSAVITSINRINSVYEYDLAIRLILIANTTAVFFYNSATDPYTNDNSSAMLGQNQTTCTNIIGTPNYDIGHVFGTGGGGVANLNSPCNAGNKARGVTGRSNPVGDPFDIDYVAHEMGHQFGGSHTFNNSCGGNRSNSNAYEPGSGSTIMAYAGICDPDVQPNSDAYMHGRSVQQISAFIQGSGNTCATIIPFSNQGPSVNAGVDRNIPQGTPFILTAVASDPNGNTISYCWEQFDNQVDFPMPPSSSSTGGPMFRSLTPDFSPSRYLPNLVDVVNGNNNTWEVLPTVSRTLNFRVTARDIAGIAGCTAQDNMIVNVASTGPFVIFTPNGGENWIQNQSQTVTWDVAGTTASPVSCSTVDIFLSTDGGFSYPIQLASAVPNSGSANVQTSEISTSARIMVRGNGNIFYDISNQDFTIEQAANDFTIEAFPGVLDICEENSIQVTISLAGINGFQGPVNLQVTNAPIGVNTSLTPQNVSLPGQSTLNISGLASLSPGNYFLTVSGSSPGIIRNIDIELIVSPVSGVIGLLQPGNGSTEVSVVPPLSWIPDAEALEYEVQVALNPAFSNIAFAENTPLTVVTPNVALPHTSLIYWRVRGITDCGSGEWSEVFSFTTVPCLIYETTTGLPLVIPAGPATVTSIIDIEDTGLATDINLINLSGTHARVSDLEITLISPMNHRLELFSSICPGSSNFNLSFDDQSSQSVISCPPTGGLIYMPVDPFSDINGIQISGTWTLEIMDLLSGSGGQLNNWALELCPAFLTILPIEWVDFEVKANEKNASALLNWTVLEDAESDRFELERSLGDAYHFVPITSVDSKFEQTPLMTYQYEDRSISKNVDIYYRIKHIDKAGQGNVSTIRQVRLGGNDKWSIYPNPAGQFLRLDKGSSGENDIWEYKILNVAGVEVLRGFSNSQRDISIKSLVPGLYVFVVHGEGETFTHRFIKE